MPKDECVEFVKKAVFHAMYHDGSSGGVCRIGIITKDGVERQVHFAPRDYENAAAAQAGPSVAVVA